MSHLRLAAPFLIEACHVGKVAYDHVRVGAAPLPMLPGYSCSLLTKLAKANNRPVCIEFWIV